MIESLDSFSLWGGDNSYNPSTKTLSINRQCGLLSNLIVTIYGICILKDMGYTTNTVLLYLNEYKYQYNFYNDLFLSKSDAPPPDKNLSKEEAYKVISLLQPTNYGLSDSWNSFSIDKLQKNLNTLHNIYKYYFNSSDKVKSYIEEISNKYNINYDKDIFIWARKTDKPNECSVPDPYSYIKAIEKYRTNDSKIFIQTDDLSVSNSFLNMNINNLIILNELPICDSNIGFHNRLCDVSDIDFELKHSISKIDYLAKFLALTNIASKCQYFVCYPGNMITMITIIKNTFNNSILFLNKDEYIHECNYSA